jgi:hypothetical protein
MEVARSGTARQKILLGCDRESLALTGHSCPGSDLAAWLGLELLCENTFKQLSRSSTSTTLLALEGGVYFLVDPSLQMAFVLGALERHGRIGSAGSIGIVNTDSSTIVNNSFWESADRLLNLTPASFDTSIWIFI